MFGCGAHEEASESATTTGAKDCQADLIFENEGGEFIGDVAGLNEVGGDAEVLILTLDLALTVLEFLFEFLAFEIGDFGAGNEVEEGVVGGFEEGFVDMDEVEAGLIFEGDFSGYFNALERGVREVEGDENFAIGVLVAFADEENRDGSLANALAGDHAGAVGFGGGATRSEDEKVGLDVFAELAEFAEGMSDKDVEFDFAKVFDFIQADGLQFLPDLVPEERDGGRTFGVVVIVLLDRDDVGDVELTFPPMGEARSLTQGRDGRVGKVHSNNDSLPGFHGISFG